MLAPNKHTFFLIPLLSHPSAVMSLPIYLTIVKIQKQLS